MVGLRANDRKAEEALLRRDGCVDGVSEVVVDATEAPDPMLQVTAIDRSTHIVCVIDDRSGSRESEVDTWSNCCNCCAVC